MSDKPDDLLEAVLAALDADPANAAGAVFALHERSPMDAAVLLLDVASGRTGASEKAQERAGDLALELVDRDTFHQILAKIIRPASVPHVRATFLFDFATLFSVFGRKWLSDVDLFAAAERDESARPHALLRLGVAAPRPDRLVADEWIRGRAADAILEGVFASLDRLESVLLGVYCETWGDDLVNLRFWVWGQKAVGFLSAYSEPIDHDGPSVFYYSKEDFGGREFPPPSARFRASGRELPVAMSHPPGRYRVHAFLADRPVSRDQMQGARGDANVLVTAKHEFEVGPKDDQPIAENDALGPLSQEESEAILQRVLANLDRKKAKGDE